MPKGPESYRATYQLPRPDVGANLRKVGEAARDAILGGASATDSDGQLEELLKNIDIRQVTSDLKKFTPLDIATMTLTISPDTSNAVREMLALHKLYPKLKEDFKRPEVQAFLLESPDVAFILRLGLYTRMIHASMDIRSASNAFINNPANDPHNVETFVPTPQVKTGIKRMDPVELFQRIDDYIMCFNNFSLNVNYMLNYCSDLIAAWMNKSVLPSALSADHPYFDHTESNSIGDMLLAISDVYAKHKKETLDGVEYKHLVEMIGSVVLQERLRDGVKLTGQEGVENEQLAAVIFELIASPQVDVSIEKSSKLTPLLSKLYKDGYPLYRMLYNTIQQIPAALTDENHPGHLATVRMVHVLNRFTYPDLLPSTENSGPTFIHLLSSGMIMNDFLDKQSFQSFVFDMFLQSQNEGPNSEWFKEMAVYMLFDSVSYSQKVVVNGPDIETHIFDLSRDEEVNLDLETQLRELMEAGEYDTMDLSAEGDQLGIEDTALRGDHQKTAVQVFKVGDGALAMNITITLSQTPASGNIDDPETRRTRFNCQLKLDHGQEEVFLPVVNYVDVPPAVHRAIINQVKKVAALVDVEALRYRTLAEQGLLPDDDDAKTDKRKSRRQMKKEKYEQEQRRLAEEQVYRPQVELPVLLGKPKLKIPTAVYEKHQAEKFSLYVPRKLIITAVMKQELENPPKKGIESVIFPMAAKFILDYNETVEFKPGEGIPLKDRVGTNGERIWRFHLDDGNRCFAVEVGNGEALVFYIGPHDDAYKGKGDEIVSAKAGTALRNYYSGSK